MSSGGPRDITFDHNTVDSDGTSAIVFYEGTAPAGTAIYGFVLTNNLLRDNAYGIFGSGSQPGTVSLNAYTPGATVLRNAIGGADPRRYPGGNDYPALAQWLADFVNRGAANYALSPTSLATRAALDGKDIGVDFTALNAALAGPSAPPLPAPAPPPPVPVPAISTPFTGSATALPGTIEAENYDQGGEGLTYHDTTAGNSSGAYRSDDVDIRVTADAGGGYNVKSIRAGEWLAYTVNVAAAGVHAISFRLASSGTGGTVHLTVDGTDVTGPIALPDTGGWGAWRTVTKTGVTLPAGTHVLRVIVDANGSAGTVADINWITVAASVTTSPPAPVPPPPPPPAPLPPPPVPSMAYTGTPVLVPGRIEAENYDKGGEGFAYHDATAGNSTGAYRPDDVDIRAITDTGGGYAVKSVRAGEWLTYSVNVGSAGTYALDVRVASSGSGGTVYLAVDGQDLTGPIVLPDTGGWNTWATVTTTGLNLAAGPHLLKIVVAANGAAGTVADINWLAVR